MLHNQLSSLQGMPDNILHKKLLKVWQPILQPLKFNNIIIMFQFRSKQLYRPLINGRPNCYYTVICLLTSQLLICVKKNIYLEVLLKNKAQKANKEIIKIRPPFMEEVDLCYMYHVLTSSSCPVSTLSVIFHDMICFQ